MKRHGDGMGENRGLSKKFKTLGKRNLTEKGKKRRWSKDLKERKKGGKGLRAPKTPPRLLLGTVGRGERKVGGGQENETKGPNKKEREPKL